MFSISRGRGWLGMKRKNGELRNGGFFPPILADWLI